MQLVPTVRRHLCIEQLISLQLMLIALELSAVVWLKHQSTTISQLVQSVVNERWLQTVVLDVEDASRKRLAITTNEFSVMIYYESLILYISTMTDAEDVFTSLEDSEWVNKTRTLIVSSRGMTSTQRQFMLSIFALLPHAKKDFKLEKKNVHEQITELCENFKTRYFMYFQVKKKVHFSLWIGRYPEGPSIKLDISGMVSVRDVRFQGNVVKGARHILSFDGGMTGEPKMNLVRELLIGMLNVPKFHPKSTAVIDHVLSFVAEDEQISFRNYQIFREVVNKDKQKIDLYEVGPRFLMKVVCILDGVISGEVLYRAQVVKNILKKSKLDPRKNRQVEEVGELNLFGEDQE